MSPGRSGIPAGVSDWAIAVCVAATLLVAGLSENRSAADADLLGYALLVAGGLALAARRWAPVPVLAVTGLCAVGYQAVGFDVPAVAFLFAVYAAVRAGHRIDHGRRSGADAGGSPARGARPATGPARWARRSPRPEAPSSWPGSIAAGAAGEALRQAERRADEAERTREETARRRADEERLHIARELHDSLTHQISIIKVQAEVAVHLARKRGEQVPEALLAIRGGRSGGDPGTARDPGGAARRRPVPAARARPGPGAGRAGSDDAAWTRR